MAELTEPEAVRDALAWGETFLQRHDAFLQQRLAAYRQRCYATNTTDRLSLGRDRQ